MAKGGGFFRPDLFEFFSDLGAHNDRDWFQANRARYDGAVREPLLRFVEAFAPRLKAISPHFLAEPRSLVRPNRDVRFSADKSPYKAMGGALFRHEQAKAVPSAPGFLLHLEPGSCFAGIGLRGPDPKTLKRVRDAIVAAPAEWTKATSGKAFRAKCALSPESLKRPPRGYDPEHPLVEDLKRLHFCTVTPFTEREACSAGFLEAFTDVCTLNAPLMAFLTRAVKLPW